MKMPYIELAGGLGDIFNQIYTGPGYRMLEHITGTMGILLVCHNPFAAELFTEHPKRELLLIHDPGYLQLAETVPVREALSHRGWYKIRPYADLSKPPVFYPTAADREVLDTLPDSFAVFQQYAGERERIIPNDLARDMVIDIQNRTGLMVTLLGRDYARNDKPVHEGYEHLTDLPGVIDLSNRLSVPGTAELIRQTRLFVGTHTATTTLAWHEHKPCLVVYDERTRQKHFTKADEWSFGIAQSRTRHCVFEKYTPDLLPWPS